MKILVAYASRYGSTRRIAERIGGQLMARGYDADCEAVAEVETAWEHDAVVLGSAVHNQAWLEEGSEAVSRLGTALASRPFGCSAWECRGHCPGGSRAARWPRSP